MIGIFLESKEGKVEVIYNFELITRTVKLNDVQIDYQEFTSVQFLEWDYLKVQTNNKTNSTNVNTFSKMLAE